MHRHVRLDPGPYRATFDDEDRRDPAEHHGAQHQEERLAPLLEELRVRRHFVGDVERGFQGRHAAGGAPHGHEEADDHRRQGTGFVVLRGGHRGAEHLRGAAGQGLTEAADQMVHLVFVQVDQAHEPQQRDEGGKQGQEPVVGQAARGHRAAVLGILLDRPLEGIPPAGLADLQRVARPAFQVPDRRDDLARLGLTSGGASVGCDAAVSLAESDGCGAAVPLSDRSCACGGDVSRLSSLKAPPRSHLRSQPAAAYSCAPTRPPCGLTTWASRGWTFPAGRYPRRAADTGGCTSSRSPWDETRRAHGAYQAVIRRSSVTTAVTSSAGVTSNA